MNSALPRAEDGIRSGHGLVMEKARLLRRTAGKTTLRHSKPKSSAATAGCFTTTTFSM